MPTIPLLEGNQVPLRAAPNVQRQPLQNTGARDAAGGLTVVGNTFAEIQRQERAKVVQASVLDATTKTSAFANELSLRAQGAKLKDAIGKTPALLAEFDAKASEIEQGLPVGRARQIYRQDVASRKETFQRQISRHEFEQGEAYGAETREGSKRQSHSNAVTHFDEPEVIKQEIANIKAVINLTPGLDDAMKAQELAIRVSGIHADSISRFLANDRVADAEARYENVKGEVEGEQATRIENAINDAKATLRAKQEAAQIQDAAGSVLSIFEADGPKEGAAALSELLGEMQTAGVSKEVQTEIRAKVNAAVGGLRTQQRERFADQLVAVERSIAAGTGGSGTQALIDGLYRRNALTPTEYASTSAQLDRSRREAAERNAGASAIADAVRTGLPLDPSNAQHRKALESAFATDTAGAKPGDPSWTGAALSYADTVRMLPPQASGWLRQAARSPDERLATRAAQFWGALELQSPEAAGELDTDTRAFLGSLSGMLEAGAVPATAFQTARSNTFEVQPGVMDRRRTAWSTLSKQTDAALASNIGRDFSAGWFSGNAAAGAGAQVAYQTQAREYFLRTGDFETAKKLAWSDVKRVYGPTKVNGNAELQPFPVERYGLTPEDVRASVDQFLAANPQDQTVTAADVRVQADRMTARAVTDVLNGTPVRPTYALVLADGSPLFTSQGVPARFAIPDSAELQKLSDERKQTADAAALKVGKRERQVYEEQLRQLDTKRSAGD